MMKITRPIFLVLMALLLCAPAWGQTLWGPEGFEGGVLEQPWVDTPTVITAAGGSGMTGSHYLDAPNAIYDVEDDLNSPEEHFKFDLRASDSGGNDYFMRVLNGTSARCAFLINSSNVVRVENNNGVVSTSYTLTVDQIYTVETRAKQGTGANAECQIRIDGGDWEGSTDGTWTDAITGWQIRGDGEVHFDFDDISRCSAGAVGDGACDAPSVTRSTIRPSTSPIIIRGGPARVWYPEAVDAK